MMRDARREMRYETDPMDSYLAWSLALFIVGAIIAIVEVIVPSGGILAVAALAALGGSLYCAYQLSGWALAGVAILQAVSIPAAIVFTFKWLPRSSFGRELMLSPPKPSTGSSTTTPVAAAAQGPSLLGRQGRAVTMLRPSGTVEIDGRRISVVTHGEMLPEDTPVRVVLVEGNRVVVEAAQ